MNGSASTPRLVLGFATLYLIWGSTYLAIRFAVDSMPPFGMASARFLVAGIAIYTWLRLRGAPRPSPSQWRTAAIVGTMLLAGANGLVTWAEQWVPSGLAALIVSSMPLWMGLLVWIFEPGVRPGTRGVAGILLGFAGVAVLVNPGGDLGAHPAMLPGTIALLLAPLLWAAGSLYSRRADAPANPFLATSMQMIAGGAALALVHLATGEWRAFEPSEVTAESFFAFLYLIVFGSMIAYSAFVWLLRVAPPSRVSTYAYVNPVVALLLGWLLAGETLALSSIVASAIIVLSVFLMTTDRPRREPAPAA